MEAALKKLIMAHPHLITRNNVDKLDYDKLGIAGDVISRMSEITNNTLGLFDMHEKKISLFMSSIKDDPETAHLFKLKDGNFSFWKKIVHDDIPFVSDTIKSVFKFLNESSSKEKKHFKLVLDFCCNVSKDVCQRFLLKLVTFKFDKKDNIWLILFSIAPFPQKPLQEKPQRRMTNVTNGKCMLFKKEQAMTERPIEILKLIAEGMTSEEIAKKLFISLATVKTHRQNILTNTYSKNTTQSLLYAIKTDLITI